MKNTRARWKHLDDKFQNRWISFYGFPLSYPIRTYLCFQSSGFSFARASSFSRRNRKIFQLVIALDCPRHCQTYNEQKIKTRCSIKDKKNKKTISIFWKNLTKIYITDYSIIHYYQQRRYISEFIIRGAIHETLMCLSHSVRIEPYCCNVVM